MTVLPIWKHWVSVFPMDCEGGTLDIANAHELFALRCRMCVCVSDVTKDLQ